jgi:oligoribonuclease (3'-5' exoribonuclease)
MRMQSGMMEQMMSHMSEMHGSSGMMKNTPQPKKDTTDADHAAHHPEK